MIQDETMTYSGKTSTAFTGLTRGAEGTIATSHPILYNGLYVKAMTEEASGINKALGFDAGAIMTSMGIVGIPYIVYDFCKITIPMIIRWDSLSYFTGMLSYIRTILIIISIGLPLVLLGAGIGNLIVPKLR